MILSYHTDKTGFTHISVINDKDIKVMSLDAVNNSLDLYLNSREQCGAVWHKIAPSSRYVCSENSELDI